MVYWTRFWKAAFAITESAFRDARARTREKKAAVYSAFHKLDGPRMHAVNHTIRT